jgi:hypothetical protein
MKYRKFNKYERKENNRAQIENALHGEGLYLYENNTNADMTLPRPTKSGLRAVGPREQFQGDNYYMQMVKVGHLRLIKELQSPNANEATTNEENLMNSPQDEKLILDQPDMVTEQGQVEHVQATPVPAQPLNEGDNQPKPDVLINESPVDDGFVIVGD